MFGAFWAMLVASTKTNLETTLLLMLIVLIGWQWAEKTFASETEVDIKIAAALSPISIQVRENGESIVGLQREAFERERRNLNRQIVQIQAIVDAGLAEVWQLTVLADLRSDVQIIEYNISLLGGSQ